MDVFIHRGRGNIDTMAHDMVRGLHPKLPIHVVPLLDEHSSIASIPNKDKAVFIYDRGELSAVNSAIVNSVWGIICVPKSNHEELADGWDLVLLAREAGVPVAIVWPNGKVTQ
jgi:hypothetical protein